jgi:hypothetical protein
MGVTQISGERLTGRAVRAGAYCMPHADMHVRGLIRQQVLLPPPNARPLVRCKCVPFFRAV